MNVGRQAAAAALAVMLFAMAGCARALPDQGPLAADSDTVSVAGEYRPLAIEGVDRLAIEGDRLVVHGPSSTQSMDLPPTADPGQRNRGWALVTEGEGDDRRTLTFTQETTLEDFTITVPGGEGQVAYGSLGGRDGHDVLIFAYGSAPHAYWGYVTITRKPAPTPRS